MAAPNVYQPVGEPLRPPRQGSFDQLLEVLRNLGPALGILTAAAAFTFLVPTLLALGKYAQPATVSSTPSTTWTSTTASTVSTTAQHGRGDAKSLDVEMNFELLGMDPEMLAASDYRQGLRGALQQSIAQKAQVDPQYVDTALFAGGQVHAVVTPPAGRTAGDLRALLLGAAPMLTQAAQSLQGASGARAQALEVSFLAASKVPAELAGQAVWSTSATTLATTATTLATTEATTTVVTTVVTTVATTVVTTVATTVATLAAPVATTIPEVLPGREEAMMFVEDLELDIKDLGAFDEETYVDAFSEELRQDRSKVSVVQTDFRAEVRYLVPHLTSDLHLRKGLAQALRVPWFAVTVEPDSARRLADTGARAVKAVVTTEDPLSAKRFAELLAQPGQVVQAMRLEGLDALPLELKQKPWASVVIHTKLELVGAPPKLGSGFSRRLSKRMGVEVKATTVGVRKVLQQELGTLKAASQLPPIPRLPLRAAKVNYNNLLSSSHRFPPVLRYGHVGYVKHGQGKVWLDVVIRVDGYKPRLNALTGEGQGHAAALNVAAGNVSKLEISLVPSEPQVEVEHLKIRHIYLQVFDIEDPPRLLADEVTVESCQEVLWPDGEKFEPSQVYTLPAGLAPEVVFQGIEGHVTLRSKRMAGNAMGAEWQGRTFFISLRSPDVVPATEDESSGFGASEGTDFGYGLDLDKSKILFNNLGGFGPGHLDEPSLLRFEKTCAVNGQLVDVVLSAPHGYHPGRVSENGAWGRYAAVNVASGSSVDLGVLLSAGRRQATVMLSRLYVSVFDDAATQRLSSLGKVAIRGFQALIYGNGTRVPTWALQNLEPHGAWTVPPGARMYFLFRYVTKLVITLASPAGGHTFYISLHSPDAEAAPEDEPKLALTTTGPSKQHQVMAFPKHMGQSFELRHSKVLYNNLAGQGPSDGPPVLRYHNVCSQNGQPVDVVLHLDGAYHPQLPQLNGLDGSYWAAPVSVPMGSSLKLHVNLVTSQDAPVLFRKLYLTVFDVEEPSVGISDAAVHVKGFEAVLWPDGRRIAAEELPKDWMPPYGPAATYSFKSTEEISLTLHAVKRPGNAVSSDWQGRIFFLALHSPEAEPPGKKEEVPEFMKMGQQLALSQRNLIYNNLGGLGPGHLDDPAELRFGETAMRGERRVDVAFHSLGAYDADASSNGCEDDRAVVSVSPGTSLELELRFIGALVSEDPGETQEALRLAAFICVEAPEGSVAVEHGEAMLFANGTVLQGHEAKAVYAPCFQVNRSTVRLSLAQPAGSPSHDFRVAVFSPEVEAFGTAQGDEDLAAHEMHAVSSFGVKLHLAKTNVICNNLGGLGPEKHVPEQLHFRSAAQLDQGPVDVVLEAHKGYRPKRPQLNGLAGHHYAASVNVATGTEARIDLRFLSASHQVQDSEAAPVMFAKLFVSVFDAEDPIPTVRAHAVVYHHADAAFFPNGTVMAQHLGKQWTSGEGMAPMVLFQDVTVVSLTLRATKSAGNSVGNFWAGRTFFISLLSPDLVAKPSASGPLAVPPYRGRGPPSALLTRARNMVYNNLGSRGPGHLDEPPVIRLDRVGRWHGQDLDVVVALIGHAHYEPCGENGLDPAGEIVVTVAFESQADLEITFATDQDPDVPLEHVYLQVSDMSEEPVASLAGESEVIYRDFKAVRYPGKSWMDASSLMEGGDWSVPSGPSPLVAYEQRPRLRVTLRPNRRGGPFTGPGRRFLLRLYAPEVKVNKARQRGRPELHQMYTNARLGKAPQLAGKMGTLFSMGHHNLRFNNLGGHGPGHLDSPALMRFENVATTRQGGQVDVALRAVGGYTPRQAQLNGRMGGHRASVNVAVGTAVDLELSLLEPMEEQLKPLEATTLVTVYDVEEPFKSLAADGELQIGGFQAIIWPNGTSVLAVDIPHDHGVWAVPAGPAPTFFFHRTTVVSFKLAAKQAGGNALGSRLAGRSFFITLQSPDLEPSVESFRTVARRTQSTPSPGRQSGVDLEAFWPSNFGPKMKLTRQNVLYNNLGGQGPNISEPPVVLYRAACFKEGRRVDVVFHAKGIYTASNSGLNALLGHYSATVNVALKSTLHLMIDFRSQGEALALPRLYVSVADSKDGTLSSSGEVRAKSFKAVRLGSLWRPEDQLPATWSAPAGNAPVFAFWNAQAVELMLTALAAAPGAVRSFFISMWSPDVDAPQEAPTFQLSSAGFVKHQAPEVDLGTSLALQELVFNNLGGLGPGHLEQPKEMRFAHVATLGGESLDLVLHAASSYHPGLVRLNGARHGCAVVSVAMGTSLTLNLLLVEHGKAMPLRLDGLELQVYDEAPEVSVAAAGEVYVSGVRAVRQRRGWQPVDSVAYEAYAVPQGPAEWLKLEGRNVQLTLAPKGSSGGRSFFITLRSPKLQAATHRLARLPGAESYLPQSTSPTTASTTLSSAPQTSGWLREPLMQGYLGPELALKPSQVLVNNLAGAGPDLSKAKELRWRAGLLQGRPLDVVLRSLSTYSPGDVSLNGRGGRYPAATVNVAEGSSVKLRLDFEEQGSHVALPRLYMQIFDVEEPKASMSLRGEAKVLDYEGVSWSNGTWQPGGFGQSFTLPAGPTPTVAFTSCSSIFVTLHARHGLGNVLGSAWEGRSFFISLRSPDVVVPNATSFAAGAAQALRHEWPAETAVGNGSALKGASFNPKAWTPKAVEPPRPRAPGVHAVDAVPILPKLQATTETSTHRMVTATATSLTWTSLTWTSVTPTTRTYSSVTTKTVPTQTVTYTLPETRTMSSTSLRPASSTTLSVTTVTVTWTAPSTRTWSSTTVSTTAGALVMSPAAPALGEYAEEVGVTMELQHVDYHTLSSAPVAARSDLVEGLRQTLAWRAGLRQGHPIHVEDLDLEAGFQGSVLLRSTLSSSRPLEVTKLQSSFQSAAFQQDLFEAINASEVGSAVRGPVWVRAVSVAPIMHSGVATKPLWKAMGLEGWRLSEVLLFMLFVLALCCLIPLLARFLMQSWSAPPPELNRPLGPLQPPPSGEPHERHPWHQAVHEPREERRRPGDLGFSSLGPPPRRFRSYDEEGSVADAMLSPTPSYPSRLPSESSPSTRRPWLDEAPQSDPWEAHRAGVLPRLVGVQPTREASSGSSSRLPADPIPAVVRARPLAPSWLDDEQMRYADAAPGEEVVGRMLREPRRVQAAGSSALVQQMLGGRAPHWSGP